MAQGDLATLEQASKSAGDGESGGGIWGSLQNILGGSGGGIGGAGGLSIPTGMGQSQGAGGIMGAVKPLTDMLFDLARQKLESKKLKLQLKQEKALAKLKAKTAATQALAAAPVAAPSYSLLATTPGTAPAATTPTIAGIPTQTLLIAGAGLAAFLLLRRRR